MSFFGKNASAFILLTGIALAGCSTSKVVVSNNHEVEILEQSGEYTKAAVAWKQKIDEATGKGVDVSADDYAHAGKTAMKAERQDWAELWFGLANYQNYSDAQMELDLAKIYRDRNETPKEIGVLEVYKQKYGSQGNLEEVNSRLFELYCQMRDFQNAERVWQSLPDADKTSELYLDKYLTLLVQTKQESAADTVATELLKLNGQHQKALEWMAERLYRKAESSYTKEMKAYAANHTQTQYLQLTQALKSINADYQKSLEYFLTLWKSDQKSVYAGYISNIYKRFDDNAKAGYYGQFVER